MTDEGGRGSMLKGFREFIMRGNVVELAVAVVVGTSFTIRNQTFDWASFINAVIAFLIAAATVYFLVVLPMNKLAERRKRGEEPEPEAPSEEVRLLTEIRDALVQQRTQQPPPASNPPA